MHTFATNLNDTIVAGDSILVKIVNVADTCQPVTNQDVQGWPMLFTLLGTIAIGGIIAYLIHRYFRMKLYFDRLLSRSLLLQFSFLGIVLFLLFLLSWLFLNLSGCDWKDFAQSSNVPECLLPLYLLIDTNAFNNLYINGVNGWALAISSVTFVIGAFIFNGAIIGMITNAIDRRVTYFQKGLIHYLKSGHYIIMGYDDIVPSIITHIFEKNPKAFVLILSSAEAAVIREKLSKSFNRELMKRILINYGHRVSSFSFKNIRPEAAEEVYVVGNHTKPAHDAINVECMDSICRYLKSAKELRIKSIMCSFKDLDTYAAFKTTEIFKKLDELHLEFKPYNFYTGWAKQVFVKREYKDFDNGNKIYEYPAVYGKGITPTDQHYVHLVFVGTTNFAVAFAMEAAHVLHFPNFNNNKKLKTKITFIDKNADIEKEEFITRNRYFFEVQSYLYYDLTNTKDSEKEQQGERTERLKFNGEKNSNFLDIEFEFIKGDIFANKVQEEICKWANDTEGQYLSFFLAMAEQRQNFVIGMNMPDAVYDKEIPVFIRQDRSDNFVTNLRTADIRNEDKKLPYSYVDDTGECKPFNFNGRYANIYPFGMNETAYCEDNHSLKRAKLINYLYSNMPSDYKFLSFEELDKTSEEEIWAKANEDWQKLTVAKKWSNLYNSYTIRTKLATLRAMRNLDLHDTSRDYDPLSDEEVRQLAEVEHSRWNVEELLMGFRKAHSNEDKYEHPEYADDLAKNKKRFVHHDIRPFDDLGPIKQLDYEFSRYIPWIMKMTEK